MREKKFERTSSSKKILKDKRSDSNNSRASYTPRSMQQVPEKKEDNMKRVESLKGINPDFRQFFMAFITKAEVPSSKQDHIVKHHLRRGTAYNRDKL